MEPTTTQDVIDSRVTQLRTIYAAVEAAGVDPATVSVDILPTHACIRPGDYHHPLPGDAAQKIAEFIGADPAVRFVDSDSDAEFPFSVYMCGSRLQVTTELVRDDALAGVR